MDALWFGFVLAGAAGVLYAVKRSYSRTKRASTGAPPTAPNVEATAAAAFSPAAAAASISSRKPAPAPVYGHWRINYRTYDENGQRVDTERYVRILEVKPRLHRIVCWCELKEAERTFSLTAISRAIDATNGNVVDLNAWMSNYKRSRRTKRT